MDLYKAIRALHEERDRLDRLIKSITELNARGALDAKPVRSRRGRRKMGAAERRQVSERMKRYWARRRMNAEAASQAAIV